MDLKEAAPIGRLLDAGGETIGWVYRWNTSELSVLWLTIVRDPISVELALQPGCDNTISEGIYGFLGDLLANGDQN